ncbi:hypothetical protein C2845_PM08G04710 [Panicum miliaceum]|uniref:Uncharacterized protein n=1 Tax=Panicum miliaceum TaxID=4540 RepID=A0A3L6QXE2_PANMI|nr:hypothetical protein C2845_PM08G04710 [Panicum miliaceum]
MKLDTTVCSGTDNSIQAPVSPRAGRHGRKPPPPPPPPFSLSSSPRRHRSQPPEAREDGSGAAAFAPPLSPSGRGRAWRRRVTPRGGPLQRQQVRIRCLRDQIRQPWWRICDGGSSSAGPSPLTVRRTAYGTAPRRLEGLHHEACVTAIGSGGGLLPGARRGGGRLQARDSDAQAAPRRKDPLSCGRGRGGTVSARASTRRR